ncbi:unnamed protein product, partial [Ectocarpus sp. 12 AP-2014]
MRHAAQSFLCEGTVASCVSHSSPHALLRCASCGVIPYDSRAQLKLLSFRAAPFLRSIHTVVHLRIRVDHGPHCYSIPVMSKMRDACLSCVDARKLCSLTTTRTVFAAPPTRHHPSPCEIKRPVPL